MFYAYLMLTSPSKKLRKDLFIHRELDFFLPSQKLQSVTKVADKLTGLYQQFHSFIKQFILNAVNPPPPSPLKPESSCL